MAERQLEGLMSVTLEKIKEILDSRLDDPDELVYLSLSFRLLDNEQKKQESPK